MIRSNLSDDRRLLLQLHLGGDRNFTYLVGDPGGDVAVVDPGFAPGRLQEIVRDHGARLAAILLTHGHSDHTGGAAALAAATGAPVLAGPGSPVPGARTVADGERLAVGSQALTALLTPGHSPDHVCWLGDGFVFTGDLLFCGKVGGTGPYFPGSSAEQEWASLHRLLELPDATIVLPGHDYYGGPGERRHSTIGVERAENPFLTCADFAAFIHLKEHWAEYKREHGIR